MTTAMASRRPVVMYLMLALTWGASFLFIKVGLTGLSAQQVATGRILLGAATLIVVMLLTGRDWPRSRAVWGHLGVVAVFLNVIPFMLVAWAEQTVPSATASIYNATTPVMTVLFGWLVLPEQRLRRVQVGGVLLSLVGVLVLVDPRAVASGAGDGPMTGRLALLAMTACYGFALTHLRRHLVGTGHDPVTLAASQVVLAAGIMVVLAPFTARGAIHPTAHVLAAMIALGCLGTGSAYVWNNRLVQEWGATRAATVTYLTPVVGVLLGVALLHEHLGWNVPVGGAVILAGIALAARAPQSAARAPLTAPEYQIQSSVVRSDDETGRS